MTDDRGPYRVFHLNNYVRQFNNRDKALGFVYHQTNPEDYEILDRSDDL